VLAEPPATLFGVALALPREHAAALREALAGAFAAQHHRPVSDLRADLETMAALRPGSRASTIRKLLAASAPLAYSAPHIPQQLLIPITATRALLTSEGRVVLDVLERADETDPVVITPGAAAGAFAAIADFYGHAQRHWIADHARGGDLRPHVFAVAILLLVNGSIGEERALRADNDRDDVDLSIRLAPVLDAFATGIGGDKLSETEVRRGLRSAWPYTEAARQLGGQVLRRAGGLWVDIHEEGALIHRLGTLLARRSRPYLAFSRVDGALDATVTAYERHARPTLASRRLSFERSDATARIREGLLDAFAHARSGV